MECSFCPSNVRLGSWDVRFVHVTFVWSWDVRFAHVMFVWSCDVSLSM